MTGSDPWDYIIVGGGIGGCVVASRLKLYLPSSRILLIEAGPDVSSNTDILQFSPLKLIGGEFDWGYKTVPQSHCNGRDIDLPSGRALGGGSVINNCGWLRGAKADYDSWAELVHDSRWSYEGQLPYFKKTERWFADDPEDSHGKEGALQIESPSYNNRIYPLADITERAWADMGVNRVPRADLNAGTNLGVGELNENRAQGARQITSSVYPLEGVTVQTDTLVRCITLDNSHAHATGVQLHDGTELRSKNVIVAAGAYRSPQLLMLSGIGPREILTKHNIETKVENNDVGKNFNDHMKLHLNWRLKDSSKGYALGSDNPIFSQPQFKTGAPLTYVTGTTIPRDVLEAAIAEDEGGDSVTPEHYLLEANWALMETMVLYLGVPPVDLDGSHISNTLVAYKPTSRGTVTIASGNPEHPPLIDPNYLATEVDRAVWRYSLRKAAQLMSSDDTALGQIISGETPFPSFEEQIRSDSTDEYLDKRVKAQGSSSYHGSSSCSMGKVVDTDLCVKGVRNLRIVDASVFPISISSHIQAAVYALAEQAAVIISGKAD